MHHQVNHTDVITRKGLSGRSVLAGVMPSPSLILGPPLNVHQSPLTALQGLTDGRREASLPGQR